MEQIEYLKPALSIPYSHHEKWDGSGYPQGLKGEAIPYEARIFAIVDVWDAITSDRPYRKAMSFQEALEYIESESDHHFEPKVVQAFKRLLGR
jgi:HD-GYP domain-containing protein (c-di-GMP phosphodiesterase class II)